MEHGGDNHGKWVWEEDKKFENAVALFANDPPSEMFVKIAGEFPGRSVEEIQDHFFVLIQDVENIDSGDVPLPPYADDNVEGEGNPGDRGKAPIRDISYQPQKANRGVPWTPEEHNRFLEGLEKYGRGDWRSISRHCVLSKTPTQVASHAQKYFSKLQRAEAAKNNPKPPKSKKAGASKRTGAAPAEPIPISPDSAQPQPIAASNPMALVPSVPFMGTLVEHQRYNQLLSAASVGGMPYGPFSDHHHASMVAGSMPHEVFSHNQFPTDYHHHHASMGDPDYGLSELALAVSSMITPTVPPPFDPISQLTVPPPPPPPPPSSQDYGDNPMVDPSYGAGFSHQFPPP